MQEARDLQWPGYQKVLKRYFGPDFKATRPYASLKKYLVHVLIATLPDPSDPHLADSFDKYLAAIELALASDNYLADQYWLPEATRRKEVASGALEERPHSLVLTALGIRRVPLASRRKPNPICWTHPG